MILELKQCNDSKIWINLYWSPQNQAPTTAFCLHLSTHFVIPSIHYSVCHSVTAYSILIDSVFHSRWLPYVLFLLAHTTAFHQSTSSCQKRPYCTLDYWLVNLPAYLLGHLSATAVYIPHCSLEFNCRVLNCYHSPSDCIGHVTSIADTYLYLLWLLLFSLFVCLYCYLSAFIMLMLNVCCSTGL